MEVIVPQGQNKKPRTVLPDPTQSTTQGGFYHTSAANGMGGPMPFFPVRCAILFAGYQWKGVMLNMR